jgi:hypothetical protein
MAFSCTRLVASQELLLSNADTDTDTDTHTDTETDALVIEEEESQWEAHSPPLPSTPLNAIQLLTCGISLI